MGPQEPEEPKVIKSSKLKGVQPKRLSRKKLWLFIATPLLLAAVVAGIIVLMNILNKPTKQDYQTLASAQRSIVDSYSELSGQVSSLSSEVNKLNEEKSDTTAQFKSKLEALSKSIDDLGSNRAIQHDPLLHERYERLKTAFGTYKSEVSMIFDDIDRLGTATEGIGKLDGPEGGKNARAFANALDNSQMRHPLMRKLVKDLAPVYRKIGDKADTYYALSNPTFEQTGEMMSVSLSILEPIGKFVEAADKWHKSIDIQDELDSLYEGVNGKLAAQGIAVKPLTKEYCLEYEELCLKIPKTWTVEAKSMRDAWTETKADNVTFRNASGEPVMHINQWGGSVGGHCQDPNPAPLRVKYTKPEATIFTDDTSTRWPKVTISKLAYSSDGGKTWQWALAGPNYLTNPKYDYNKSDEYNAALKPIFDTELTLTGCGALFTRYNTALRAPSQNVIGEGVTATLQISADRCVFANYLTDPKCTAKTYKSADAALDDPDLQAAVDAIKSARYKQQTEI